MDAFTLPPLSKKELSQLRLDAANVRMAANRKGLSLSEYEAMEEARMAEKHFGLGAWLFYNVRAIRASSADELDKRVDCLYRLFAAGINNPGYQFFTVFDFGERDFDSIFEAGDSARVLELLRLRYRGKPLPGIRDAFEYYGWELAAGIHTPALELVG